jgi:hypothetical protein
VDSNRQGQQDVGQSSFRKYDQWNRSAPSRSAPIDDDMQDDDNVIDYLHQKKSVRGVIENSRQTVPKTVVRRDESYRSARYEREGESDDRELYDLGQRGSGSRGEVNQDFRERMMQNVREHYDNIMPQSMETMSHLNQELKYTKMFATNSSVYPPPAKKIGEPKDIKAPIMSRDVFSPPSTSREYAQHSNPAENDNTTRFQDYLGRTMMRSPQKDMDIRQSRGVLKGNRLQELLSKDNDATEEPHEEAHASHSQSRKAFSRGRYGNNNNIGSRAYLNDTQEGTFNYSQDHINQREGIQFREEPYDRNETFTVDEKDNYLQQVEQRGNGIGKTPRSRNMQIRERSQTPNERSIDHLSNELQNISRLGNDSSSYNGRFGPKHSTPKESPIDPELQRIWENRNNQTSGSLLERMRNSQTVQDKFFSGNDSLKSDATDGNFDSDGWNTDGESRVGRRLSRDRVPQSQRITDDNRTEHILSRPGYSTNTMTQSLSRHQGASSTSSLNRESSAFFGPQSLLGDEHVIQRQSFIGSHKSSGSPMHSSGSNRQFRRNSDRGNSEEFGPRN